MANKILLALLVLFLLTPKELLAQEFEISNNGEASSSEVVVTSSDTETINQSNTANIENNIHVSADTGSNSIEESGGNSSINTGDIKTNIQVVNETNTSISQSSISESQTSSIITGNGSESRNSSTTIQANNSTVVSVNTAVVSTKITGVANTGKNTVSNNLGNTLIKTGNITSLQSIQNGPINSNFSILSMSKVEDKSLIGKNGANSINKTNTNLTSNVENYISNNALVENINKWNYNTGWNRANNDLGEVQINTGNIFAQVIINNKDINTNKTLFVCNPETKPTVPPIGGDSSNPSSSSSSVSSGSSSGSSSGIGGSGPQILGLSDTSSNLRWQFIMLLILVSSVIGIEYFHRT